VLVFGFAVCGWPSASQAQTAETDETAEQARVHFQAGVALARDGNYAGALGEFEQSYALRPNPALRYNLGLCEFHLGRLVDARRDLQLYLTENEASRIPDARRTEVSDVLAQMAASVGLFDIEVSVAGATVTVDDVDVGTSPLADPIAVMPGSHEVRVTLDGYATIHRMGSVAGGERVDLFLQLVPLAAIVTQPAPGPLPPMPLAATEGIEEGEGLSPAWFWTSVAVAGAFAVAGTVTGVLAELKLSDFDDAAALCNTGFSDYCDDGLPIKSAGQDLAIATTALFVTAGAVAAGAFALAFFTDFGGGESRCPAVALGVAPVLGTSGSELSGFLLDARWRF
jgi:hypothetical protein